MAKRVRVPVALHSELSEYASLVRSLRTNIALDLSTQVSKFGASSSRSSQYEDEDEDEIDELDPTEDEAEGQEEREEVKPPKAPALTVKQKELQSAHRRTRWPLRPEKAPQPEFELADEVQALIDRYRHRKYLSSEDHNILESEEAGATVSESGAENENHPEGQDAEEESGAEDEDAALPMLASLTAAHLRTLLETCATHVPKVSFGMHNRLLPINWKGVLLAASSSDAVPPNVIDRVEGRLRTIYPSGKESSETWSASRLSLLHATQARLNSLFAASIESGDGDVLRIVSRPVQSPMKQSKRKGGHPTQTSHKRRKGSK